MAAPYEAWSIVQHGSLDLRRYPEMHGYLGYNVLELPDGRFVSRRPPGTMLVAVPFVAPLALMRSDPPDVRIMNQLGKLAAAFSIAVGGACFFAMCKRLAPAAAWPATILLLFGTCLWSVAGQALWMHGPATMWLCIALYCLTCGRNDSRALEFATGFALGMAVLTRPSTALFGLATGMAILWRRQFRAFLCFALGSSLPLAFLLLLNWSYFGAAFLGGYAVDHWEETPPWWLGIGGLLLAPSRGVLVYSPALCLIPWGIAALIRERQARPEYPRAMLIAWLAAAGATLVFYGRWHEWRGGWCFGPRFLCETMPILCLFFALAYDRSPSHSWKRIAAGLVGISVAIHFVGVFGYSGYADWHNRHERNDLGRCLFELEDTQIEAHTRALLVKLGAKASALN
jgi:hypothetical protein